MLMKASPPLVRRLNERRIMNALREHKRLSRVDLERQLNLSAPTVSRIVEKLLHDGWIRELYPAESQTAGRKPILLDINPEGSGALGIELGRGMTRIVYTNMLAELRSSRIVWRGAEGPEDLARMVKCFLVEENLTEERLIGIGVAAPGACFPNQEMIVPAPDLGAEWSEPDAALQLQDELGVPVYLANDANAAVLAETWFGAARHAHHVAFVLADIGLGAGLAVAGSIYEGSARKAGEFSHTIVSFETDVRCEEGHTGCVESHASAKAIFARLRTLREVHVHETIEHVVNRAIKGIEPDASVVDKAFRYLAAGIANLVRIFDPEVVVLGGRMVLASQMAYEKLRGYVHDCLRPERKLVMCAHFGLDAVAMGAASLVLQTVYDHTQLVG
ncbi:MAG: ROK family transcriptional regulator [Alicyclobacillus sp.]|nr:ROK family transcriptional regulator [Alicyclobacillus sp.]